MGMSRWQQALQRAREGSRDASGSLTLALLVVVTVLIVSVGIVSVLAYQVAGDRNEESKRRAQWAMDSAMNNAAERLGTAGRSINSLISTEPASYAPLPNGAAGKWWVTVAQAPNTTAVTLPGNPVALGNDGSSWLMVDSANKVYRTSDGQTWAAVGTVPGATAGDVMFFGNSVMVVPAAANTTGVQNPIRYSTDGGKTWQSATLPGTWLGTESTYDMACSPTSCVLVATGSGGGRAYRTTNGTTWSLVGTSPTALTAIAYGNNRYVTVGTNLASTSSDDGATWTNAAGMASGAWALVGYGNGTFFTTPKNSPTTTVLASTNGTTWASQSLAAASDSYAAFGNADNAAILLPTTGSTYQLSPDGTAWITRAAPVSGSWLGASLLDNTWLFAQTGSPNAYLVGMNAVIVPAPVTIKVNAKVQVSNLATPLLAQMTYSWSGTRWTPSDYTGAQTNLSVPGAPTGFSVSTPNARQQVNLSWGAPTSDGGATITGYTVYLSSNSSGPWTPIAANLQATSFQTTGLVAGSYWFQVTASNWVGEGPPSTSTSGVAIDLPGAAAITSLSSTVVGSLTANFTPPTATTARPVASLTARACTDAAMSTGCLTPASLAANATTTTFTGGTPGTLYYVRVDSTNSAGTTNSTVSSKNVAYTATQTCPSGGTLSGTTCTNTYTSLYQAAYYQCNAGDTPTTTSASSFTCTQTVAASYQSAYYTCSVAGSVLVGSQCAYAATATYAWNACSATYSSCNTLTGSGATCSYSGRTACSWAATATTTYSCPASSGTCTYSSGNGTATCNGTKPSTSTGSCRTSCSTLCNSNCAFCSTCIPAGCSATTASCTDRVGRTCGYSCTTSVACTYPATASTTYSCPASSGSCTYSSGNGTATCSGTQPVTCSYSNSTYLAGYTTCSSGGTYTASWNGYTDRCVYNGTLNSGYYYCTTGTLSGTSCLITYASPLRSAYYYCTAGDTPSSTSATSFTCTNVYTSTPTCPTGGTLSGTTCTYP